MNSHIIPPDILYCIVNVPSTLSGADFARLCRVSNVMRRHAEKRLYSTLLFDMNRLTLCKELHGRVSESQNRLCRYVRSLEVLSVEDADGFVLDEVRLFLNQMADVLGEMHGLLGISLVGPFHSEAVNLLTKLPETVHTLRLHRFMPDCWDSHLETLSVKVLDVDNWNIESYTSSELLLLFSLVCSVKLTDVPWKLDV